MSGFACNHEHILEQTVPFIAVLQLEAVLARAREEEEEELPQAVSQDETVKVRQAEVYHWRHLEKLEERMWNEGLL